MDLSIIIVNWNTRDLLRDCLASVVDQTRCSAYEIIVVDNDSSDGSVEMVRGEFPDVVLIVNETNVGFAAANNQGMEIARGRYVLLLNSDTVVLDGAIDKALDFAEAHPQAGVVGCRVLNEDRSLQNTCFMYPSVLNMALAASYLYKVFPRSRFFGRERMTWWPRDDVREVDVVTGCFMLVRRDAIEQVGLFDTNYFVYGEETDWCYRFRAAGWRVLFTAEAEIVHYGGASSKSIKEGMILQLRSSVLLFFAKHKSSLEYFISRCLASIHFFTRIPFLLIDDFMTTHRKHYLARTYFKGCFLSLKGWKALAYSPSESSHDND